MENKKESLTRVQVNIITSYVDSSMQTSIFIVISGLNYKKLKY